MLPRLPLDPRPLATVLTGFVWLCMLAASDDGSSVDLGENGQFAQIDLVFESSLSRSSIDSEHAVARSPARSDHSCQDLSQSFSDGDDVSHYRTISSSPLHRVDTAMSAGSIRSSPAPGRLRRAVANLPLLQVNTPSLGVSGGGGESVQGAIFGGSASMTDSIHSKADTQPNSTVGFRPEGIQPVSAGQRRYLLEALGSSGRSKVIHRGVSRSHSSDDMQMMETRARRLGGGEGTLRQRRRFQHVNLALNILGQDATSENPKGFLHASVQSRTPLEARLSPDATCENGNRYLDANVKSHIPLEARGKSPVYVFRSGDSNVRQVSHQTGSIVPMKASTSRAISGLQVDDEDTTPMTFALNLQVLEAEHTTLPQLVQQVLSSGAVGSETPRKMENEVSFSRASSISHAARRPSRNDPTLVTDKVISKQSATSSKMLAMLETSRIVRKVVYVSMFLSHVRLSPAPLMK